MSVNNPANNSVIPTITVGNGASAVAVSPTGTYAGDFSVTNAGDDTVSLINYALVCHPAAGG